MVEYEKKPFVVLKNGEKTILFFDTSNFRTTKWHWMGGKASKCSGKIRADGKIEMGTCVLCDQAIQGKGNFATPQFYYDVKENGVRKVLSLRKTSKRNFEIEVDALRRFAGADFDISKVEFVVDCPNHPKGWKILEFKVKGKDFENPSVEKFVLSDGERALLRTKGIKTGDSWNKLAFFQGLLGEGVGAERAKIIADNVVKDNKISLTI